MQREGLDPDAARVMGQGGLIGPGNPRGGDQIFLQPLKGGAEVQLTKFKRGGLGSYGWTADGKLVYIRNEYRGDVVLFEGL